MAAAALHGCGRGRGLAPLGSRAARSRERGLHGSLVGRRRGGRNRDRSFVSWTIFLKKKHQNNYNYKTLQPLHSSACRGAFFSSCKMDGEGCENNDLSTYYRFPDYRRCMKRIQSGFLKVSCRVKLFFFPCFEPGQRIFECFRLVKLTPVLAECKKQDYFWHFSIIFFPSTSNPTL